MPSLYRTVRGLLPLSLAVACTADVERVAIVAHYVPACAPSAGSVPRQLELVALGDFERSSESVAVVASDASDAPLAWPEQTRAVEATALGARAFWGVAERSAAETLDVLLWPRAEPCRIAAGEAQGETVALTVAGAPPALWIAGARFGAEGAAWRFDLGRGELAPAPDFAAPPDSSLSRWGTGALVAGGRGASGAPFAAAHGYDAERPGAPLTLSAPRAAHAALALPGGDALLVGGVDADGQALGSVEVVFADPGRAPLALPLLRRARIEPRVIPFADERFLVGGGYTLDGVDPDEPRTAIGSVEILSLDFSSAPAAPLELLPAALDRAFVSLGPAGALALGGCRQNLRAPQEDCAPCGGSGRGCVAREAWWIDAGGAVHELEPLPPELAVARPLLAAAADGAAWLLAGDRLARFEPWRARFVEVALPSACAGEPVHALDVDAGLLVWLTREGERLELCGLLHERRTAFSQDLAPLVGGGATRLLPGRPPSAGDAAAPLLAHSPARGLELSGSGAVVSVADTSYGDLRLELRLAEGPPPFVRLHAPGATSAGVTFGALECPWPAPTEYPSVLSLTRRGDRVELAREGEPDTACVQALPERVSVQLAGTPLGRTRIERLELSRSALAPSAR